MGFTAPGVGYPWDALAPHRAVAERHPGGVCDLSIGTPVDPTPAVVQDALRAAADAPGYPTAHGTPQLRAAVADWYARRRRTPGLDPAAVLPTVGSKELVALLPSMLGIGPGDVVVIPSAAYPTYEIGATLAGAQVLVADDPEAWAGREEVALVWLNSPSNPTGEVLSAERMAAVVAAARDVDAVVASDECYAELPWTAPWTDDGVPCVLEPRVAGTSHTGLLSVYSLSKQSNLAGYRAAFVAGDPAIVDALLQLRRHMGMMVPAPVQAAMVAALADDEHVAQQRARYAARRATLLPALQAAGFAVDHSEAGLYLWARRTESATSSDEAACWAGIAWLAERGIVAGPGVFYGPAAADHVRIALTASDDRIAEAARRLTAA